MTAEPMVRVEINTEVELYPELGIAQVGKPEMTLSGFDIPERLWDDLVATWRAHRDAEIAIMRYVAERHDVPDVTEWLREEGAP